MSRKIVCLIGSTKYYHAFQKVEEYQTLQGNIILTCHVWKTLLSSVALSENDKQGLDELHKYKIRMADEIIVVNAENYIGESTRNEISFAESLGKVIRYTYGKPLRKKRKTK